MSGELVPPTEAVNAGARDLDLMPTPELIDVLVRENRAAVDAALARCGQIAAAVDAIAQRIANGGRLHYFGSGTSGRLGVLDAAECPPTFGTARHVVQAHIAGGSGAIEESVEGAEDDAEAGRRDARASVVAGDAAVGISASGGASYVVAALSQARSAGALTVAVTNARVSALEAVCELAIVLETGAEVLAGSTRMKAGTAQKIALNALSTALMVRLGKVHDVYMVDLVAGNDKLRRRARALVVALGRCEPERAAALLTAAGGNVKAAVVMARRGVDAAGARTLLGRHGGRLRAALDET